MEKKIKTFLAVSLSQHTVLFQCCKLNVLIFKTHFVFNLTIKRIFRLFLDEEGRGGVWLKPHRPLVVFLSLTEGEKRNEQALCGNPPGTGAVEYEVVGWVAKDGGAAVDMALGKTLEEHGPARPL